MPIASFKTVPTNTAEWERFFRGTAVVPSANSVSTDQLQADAVLTVNIKDANVTTPKIADTDVTDPKLADMPALSLKARAIDTDGVPGNLLAAAADTFCVRRGDQLVFDPLLDSDVPITLARSSDVATSISTAISALQAQPDPFPIYTTATELASALGGYDTRTVADTRNVLASNVLNGSATYDPPSLTDGSEASTTVTVTGAVLGDFALASFSLSTQGIKLAAEVTAANTVTVNLNNKTGGTLDLASGTLRARVWKQ